MEAKIQKKITKMYKIEEYIYRVCKIACTFYSKSMYCKHKWEEFRDGYKCKKCDFYTGISGEINNLIEKLLTTKPKVNKETEPFKSRAIFSKPITTKTQKQ